MATRTWIALVTKDIVSPLSTRYQGSKLKLLAWIWDNIRDLPFGTALDAFGGTGCVSYMLKSHGKIVTYNDYLQFNRLIGRALIENNHTRITTSEIEFVMARHPQFRYADFIQRTFSQVFYTDAENAWLDVVAQNIPCLEDTNKQAIAYYALFQACIIKRPYNLFHRKNLYMRTADVTRSFGNKSTWDTPFPIHFRNFADEANRAVFDSGTHCVVHCSDAVLVPGKFDLVYIDTPYINGKGVGVDYLDFYHFVEGLANYQGWGSHINPGKKHLPLTAQKSPWADPKAIYAAFATLFERFRDSILVVSYRSDGIPNEVDLVELLHSVKSRVRVMRYGEYKYVLSRNSDSKELLLIAE